MKIVPVNYYNRTNNGSENKPPDILISNLRRKKERSGKKVESRERKEKRKIDDNT